MSTDEGRSMPNEPYIASIPTQGKLTDSNLSLEEHVSRMEKLDPESTQTKESSNGLRDWFKKNILRKRDHSTGAESIDDVAKRQKVERVLHNLLEDIKDQKNTEILENIMDNPSAFIKTDDERMRNNRQFDTENKKSTVSEQLSSDIRDLAEETLRDAAVSARDTIVQKSGDAFIYGKLDDPQYKEFWTERLTSPQQKYTEVRIFLKQSQNNGIVLSDKSAALVTDIIDRKILSPSKQS